jgi:hypothetical protein
MGTQTAKHGTDELFAQEEADNARFQELKGKEDMTQEEQDELTGLKERHGLRTKSRIDKLTWEKKTTQEKLDRETQRAADLEARIKALESGRPADNAPEPMQKETLVFEGKQFYSDDALLKRVESGQMTEAQAAFHQRQRDRAEDREQIRKETVGVMQRTKEEQEQAEQIEWARTNYPKLFKDSPEYDPADPLVVEVVDLMQSGLRFDPRGLKKAIQKAEKIVGKTGTKESVRHDRTDDFTLDKPGSTRTTQDREDNPELTADEKRIAESIWCTGETVNPKTKKEYTKQEAHIKYLEARKGRKAQYE